MKCPNCECEVESGARFCPECGSEIPSQTSSESEADSATGTSPTAQYDIARSKNRGVAKKIIGSLVTIAVLALAVFFAFGDHFDNIKSFFGGAPADSSASALAASAASAATESAASASAANADTTSASAEEQSQDKQENTSTTSADQGTSSSASNASSAAQGAAAQQSKQNADPKTLIDVYDIELKEDSGGRYVITGTVANTADVEYTATCEFHAQRHQPDKYGDDTAEDTTRFSLITTSPYASANGNTAVFYQMKPGERRSFTFYPGDWCKSDITYTDVSADVTEVTLPASVVGRFGQLIDVDGEFEVTDLVYSGETLKGKLTNNSDIYMDRGVISFVMLDTNGDPAPRNTNDTRPSGAVTYGIRVETLKPGASLEFEERVGSGYASIQMLDFAYLPDEAKQ